MILYSFSLYRISVAFSAPNSDYSAAVPLAAEWTHPYAFTQHGRSLSSAALLQRP